MKILFFTVLLSVICSVSLAQTKTGQIGCVLHDGAESLRNKVDILQNADGTGGVSEVVVEGFGIKCSANGFAKFGKKQLLEVAITTRSGEVIKTSQSSDSAIMHYGESVLCTCMIF